MSGAARPPGRDPLALLRRPPTLRARCAAVTQAVTDGLSPHFKLDRRRLDETADFVATVMQERHPDGRVPAHGAWRHLQAGGVDRIAEFDALLAGRPAAEQARARFDLAMLGVLLDAGAGPQWRYTENANAGDLPALALPAQRRRTEDLFALLDQVAATPVAGSAGARPLTAQAADATDTPPADATPERANEGVYTESEGLAVASFRAFVGGAFSAATDDPLRADAATLRHVDSAALRAVFQVTPNNPLTGLDGRAGTLARLGEALQAEADRGGGQARPGLLYDRITVGGTRPEVDAAELLGSALRLLAPVWRTGILVSGVPAGDVWPHRWAGAGLGEAPGSDELIDRTTPGWVPFHMAGQWLVYTLVEPLSRAGAALEYHEFPTPGKSRRRVAATKQMVNQRDLALAYFARRGRGLRGDRRRPGQRLPLHRARQPGGGGHQRHRGAGPGRHRPAGGQAGDGRQGGAVQEVRRHRRLRHRDQREEPRQAGRHHRRAGAHLRRHQPRGHQGAGLLLRRAQAARAHEDPGLPRRPARHRHRRRRGLLNALKVVGKDIGEVKLVASGAGAAALACLGLLLKLGLKRENIWVTDLAGVVYEGRTELMDEDKAQFAQPTERARWPR
jgi:hypothetical protein